MLVASLAGLAATLVLALADALGLFGVAWGPAHQALGLAGALLPALYALIHAVAGPRLSRPLEGAGLVAALTMAGATLLAFQALLEGSVTSSAGLFLVVALAFSGHLALLFGALLQMRSLRLAMPPRGTSLVDIARDPLTKGDDACLKQLKLGHIFLVVGLAAQTVLAWPFAGASSWMPGARLAADHLLLVGFGLPVLFGVSHLLVPRLSGVPAIAAGAIKGELHSTLLGVTLLTAGFAFGIKGLTIAGGLVVFFAAFVWMGVLGANIMKNKSRTQRVTPGFAYIPWVFSGVLWIVVGVLLGLFLNIVPQVFADRLPALRSVHAHLLLFGGALQLGLGLVARAVRVEPVPFSLHRWSFFALNVALGLLAWGFLTESPTARAQSAALGLLGLAAWFFPLVRRAAPVKA